MTAVYLPAGRLRHGHGKIRPANFLAERLLLPARRVFNREAFVAAPVLEIAGDENFPVARGARLLASGRSQEGGNQNRQRGKEIPVHGTRLQHPAAGPKVF